MELPKALVPGQSKAKPKKKTKSGELVGPPPGAGTVPSSPRTAKERKVKVAGKPSIEGSSKRPKKRKPRLSVKEMKESARVEPSSMDGFGAPPPPRPQTRTHSANELSMKSNVTSRDQKPTVNAAEQLSPEARAVAIDFVKKYAKLGLHALRVQYAEMRTVPPANPEKTAFEKHVALSRYKDIPCWDKTRVVLHWPPDEPNDFVHANYVRHDVLEQPFICTQGPTDATIPDFWRMVWQEKVRRIIMLCQCNEQGKPKCSAYWPAEKGATMEHHGLSIAFKEKSEDGSVILTKILVSLVADPTKKMLVEHRQWTAWPDKSVPKTPVAPFRISQHTRKIKSPAIIHCSAGVGRTGTLVALEIIYRLIVAARLPDVRQLVLDIRSQRSHAVQTEDQFLFMFYALFYLLNAKTSPQAAPGQPKAPGPLARYAKKYATHYAIYLKLLNTAGGKALPLDATEPEKMEKLEKEREEEASKESKTPGKDETKEAGTPGVVPSDDKFATYDPNTGGASGVAVKTMMANVVPSEVVAATPTIMPKATQVPGQTERPDGSSRRNKKLAAAKKAGPEEEHTMEENEPSAKVKKKHATVAAPVVVAEKTVSPPPENNNKKKVAYQPPATYVKIVAGERAVPRYIPNLTKTEKTEKET